MEAEESKDATPALMLMRNGCSFPTSTDDHWRSLRSSSATERMTVSGIPFPMIQNSSPPIRKTGKWEVERELSRLPMNRRTLSPTSCQKLSLTRLKLSMSKITRERLSIFPFRRAWNDSENSASKWRRFPICVSSSVIDARYSRA